MKILDCETIESTYKSIEIILGLNKGNLQSIFDEIDLKSYEDFDSRFFHKSKVNLATVDYNGVCWFHLTRIGNQTSFSDGILPLHLCLENVWNFIYTLVEKEISKSDWNTFKNTMSYGEFSSENNHCSGSQYLYRLKTENKLHGGPFAVLVKEIAFNSETVGNHDYLTIPEIVEDIFTCFQFVFGFSLIERYLKSTESCIVKFFSNHIRDDLVNTTLFYLYSKYKDLELSLDSNTCFDGEGNVVPTKDILKIEWLK